jgi:hypothetical protein
MSSTIDEMLSNFVFSESISRCRCLLIAVVVLRTNKGLFQGLASLPGLRQLANRSFIFVLST